MRVLHGTLRLEDDAVPEGSSHGGVEHIGRRPGPAVEQRVEVDSGQVVVAEATHPADQCIEMIDADLGIPYITLLGRRGGSALAAAAVNALAGLEP